MSYQSLHDRLRGPIAEALKKELLVDNVHALPGIEKVVVNVGINRTKMDGKEWQEYVAECLSRMTGQRPVMTRSRKAISNFKIRQGLIVGGMVTLRGRRMEEFLDRLLSYALPRIRDFRGVTTKLDGHGNYSIGIRDHSIFPEVPAPDAKQIFGLQVQITTTTDSDEEARALLKRMGMPFRPERKKGRDSHLRPPGFGGQAGSRLRPPEADFSGQAGKRVKQLKEGAGKKIDAAREGEASREQNAKKDADSVDSKPGTGDT